MSFFLARFFRPTSRTFPAVFFSSTSKLFDNALTLSREKVKAILKEQGFTGTINYTGTDFNKKDLQALKVSFQPALKCNVVPCNELQDNLAIEKYILPNIDSDTLTSRTFDVDQLKEISDDQVKTFLTDMHAILKNLGSDEGMDESMTDILLNNLLVQIIGLHKHPLKVSIQPRCRLYIADEPYVTAHPEFVVTRKDVSMVVVEDKHLRNTCLTNPKGFGEAQLASEILACGSENMRQTLRKTGLIPDQTIFGIRAISTYFTFYKTVISKEYWNELDFSLPQTESVVIKRWPEGERPEDGLDIAEPNGRREVLDALARIRQFLLQ